MNKLKVIGFGTGNSCRDFLKFNPDEYEIIALSDWNVALHGNQKYGYNIISPFSIKNYNYDKILILSFYVREVKKQLIDRLGIEEYQLIIPPKHKFKGRALPFEDENTKAFARECLVYFSNLFNYYSISCFLDYGALLGLARDGDLISWDDDIDFSVLSYDTAKIENILLLNAENFPESDKLKWSCKVFRDQLGNVWYFSLVFTNKTVKFYREFEIAFTVRKFHRGHAIKMRNDYQSAPESFFKESEKFVFMNAEITVPKNYEKYLDFYYKNWREPQKLTFGANYGISFLGNLDEIKIETKEELLF